MYSNSSSANDIVSWRNSENVKQEEILISSDSKAEITKKKSHSSNIKWLHANLKPHIHTFDDRHSGIITENITYSSQIIDYFRIFFSEDLMTHITNTTNNFYRYAVEQLDNIPASLKKWHDTTINELYHFIALTLTMSRLKKLSCNEYWSTNEIIRTDVFGKYMTRDRYLALQKVLHFSDDKLETSKNLLTKIREPYNKLRETFKKSFCPFKDLCIDESHMLYNRRLSFKQYKPKRDRFGIKTFVLCDCKTGYVLDFIVYTGATSDVDIFYKKFGRSGNIVVNLLQQYLGKGHQLFVNNWFSSPALFKFLHNCTINSCGTVRKRRENMPKMKEKLKSGELSFRSSGNLLALKWQSKHEVWMLSTSHSAEYRNSRKINYYTGEVIQKPTCILDYYESMEIVNETNRIISTVARTRKTLQRDKRLFFHLLDLSVWNSYCLYKFKTKKILPMSEFHLALIAELLQTYPRSMETVSFVTSESLLRLTERHFPTLHKSDKANRKNPMRRCAVCSKRDKRRCSRYCCKQCNVGLCIVPCFEMYHTQLYF